MDIFLFFYKEPQPNDVSDSDRMVADEDVESANEVLLCWLLSVLQPIRRGVDGYDGVEQLEGGPEPELGLLLLDSGENRASQRRPLFSSSSWRCWQISSGSRWCSSSRARSS